jgi:hypothetical protein
MLRMRVPLSLAAVLVLVAVAAGVLVGGRVASVRNVHPGISPTPATTFGAQLTTLLERPVVLKKLSPGSGCFHKSSGVRDFEQIGGAIGPGPAYVYVGNGVNPSRELDKPVKFTPAGAYFAFNILAAAAEVRGPLLVRGQERYDARPLLFPGRYSPDETQTQLMVRPTEFIIDTRQDPLDVISSKYAVWYTVAAIPGQLHPRCIGFQVDGFRKGVPFTSTLTFEAENMGW